MQSVTWVEVKNVLDWWSRHRCDTFQESKSTSEEFVSANCASKVSIKIPTVVNKTVDSG